MPDEEHEEQGEQEERGEQTEQTDPWEDLDAEVSALLDENERLTVRVAELENAAHSSDALSTREKALEAREAYAEIAEELGIKPKYRGTAWRDAEFKSEGDAIDRAAMTAHFKNYLETRPEFIQQKPERAKLSVDDNIKRGPSKPAGDGRIRATAAQLSDVAWTDEFFARIAADAREGRVPEIIED
jgi:hypothetical protein